MGDIHLVKLCVGAENLDSLLAWEKERPEIYRLHTRNRPKRFEELIRGGSLYWVIKGLILCRREIVSFDVVEDQETPLCWIGLRNRHIPTQAQPRRPFQGWRYLEAKAAPKDLLAHAGEDLPETLVQQLKDSGVW